MKKNTIRIAALGDIMLAREVGRHYLSQPEDFRVEGIKKLLSGSDIVFANLENPVSINGTPDSVQDPNVTFSANPETLKILKSLGVNVVSLGNNHMLDYGESALCDTLKHLDDCGIKHAGAGRDYEEANRPLLMEVKGRKIAVLSHVFIYSASTRMASERSPGVSDHRIRRIISCIKKLTKAGRDVIVSLHWGVEYSFFPLPYQMEQARRMIDAGATLVFGHGPHYPQGIEKYKNGEIVYSLGNFIFDEPHKYANRSFIYEATLGDGTVHSQVHPVVLKNHVPFPASGKDRENLGKLIASLGRVYPRKSAEFWKKLNNIYFMDISGRVLRMKSLKFAFLPPPSFYLSIGLSNYIRKVKPANLKTVMKYPVKRLSSIFKKIFRTAVPVELRMRMALFLNRIFFNSRDHLSMNILRDLMEKDPKKFHKFLWTNHVGSYARWYDSDGLFETSRMEPSRAEFFQSLKEAMAEAGIPEREIKSVLEVGCSLGYLLRFVEKDILPGAEEIMGIDIDAPAIDKGAVYLKKAGSRVKLVAGDMEELDKLVGDKTYDLVFAAGVLSYLNEDDALKVVSEMLRRTNKMLALAGLACKTKNNDELEGSIFSDTHNNQWLHNFSALVKKAGGEVVKARWEGAKEYNFQTIYFVFAIPVRQSSARAHATI